MEDLIKRLKSDIRSAETFGDNLDDASWGMQEGCLISCMEAKEIVKLLENRDMWISLEEHSPTKKEIDEKMTKTEQFNKKVESITDAELTEKCSKALSKLCETGGKSFKMCIPPMVDDTDILFGELIGRFKSRNKGINGEWNGVKMDQWARDYLDQINQKKRKKK